MENRWPFGCPNIEAGRAVRTARILLRQGFRLREGFVGQAVGQVVGRVAGQVCANGCKVAGPVASTRRIMDLDNYIVDLVN